MRHLLDSLSAPTTHIIDTLALSTLVAFFFTNVIPAATVSLTFLWVLLRVVNSYYELKLNRREYKERRK